MKYESSITYHLKAIANVKFLLTNKLADGQTDRPKTICPRPIDAGA